MHPTYSRIIFYTIYFVHDIYSSCWRSLELHTIHDYRPQYILPGPSVTFGYIRLLASLYIISYKHYFYPYDSMLVSSECFISYIHIIRYTQHSPHHRTMSRLQRSTRSARYRFVYHMVPLLFFRFVMNTVRPFRPERVQMLFV